MNKPIQSGELCVIVSAGRHAKTPGLLGRFVITEYPVSGRDVAVDGLMYTCKSDCWVVRAAGDGQTLPTINVIGDKQRQVQRRAVPAICLKPIRGDDAPGETAINAKELAAA